MEQPLRRRGRGLTPHDPVSDSDHRHPDRAGDLRRDPHRREGVGQAAHPQAGGPVTTKTTYERCGELFATYPLAVDDGEMVLMTGDARFFILDRDEGDHYRLHRWSTAGTFEIEAETWDVPAWVTDVLTHGTPLPRDGSLFGWRSGKDI